MINTPNSSSENSNKPKFSTVKKAIQLSAERQAAYDGRKKPKSKHYKEAFDKLRELKKTNPELLEKAIITSAEYKDIKDELGSDLYRIFQEVWTEVSTGYLYRIRQAEKQMNEEKMTDPDKAKQKFINSINDIFNEMIIEVRKRPLITHSFVTEKEKNLLDKVISQTKTGKLELIELAAGTLTQEQKLNAEKQESKSSDNKTAEDLKTQLLESKPNFGTIRKAIKGSAEEMTSKEFLKAPEQRHIDAIIGYYKLLQEDPKLLGKMINLAAKGKEITDELGLDLHKLFGQVRNKELTATMSEDIDAAMLSYYQTKNPSDKDAEKELLFISKRYLDQKAEQLRKDPRIITAFAGKKALLDKVLDFAVSSVDIAQSLSDDIAQSLSENIV